MGEHFKADTHQLGGFVASLRRSMRDLDEARKALSHVRADQIGTARLDEACDTFQGKWKHGSEQLGQMIGAISEGVDANMQSYDALEDNLAKALKQMGDTSATGGGGKS